MRKLILIAGLILSLPAYAGIFDRTVRPQCAPESAGDQFVYSNDFHWGYTLEEMAAKYKEIYESGKRLKGRAYYDVESAGFVFPHRITGEANKVKIPDAFIRNVTKQVEVALQRRYADFVFFPDMGHSHFHYPKEWDKDLKKEKEIYRIYERMIANPDLKMLYHTAEQLQLEKSKEDHAIIEDKELQWRYYTRNPTGDNTTGENVAIYYAWGEKYNTVKDVPGHTEWSAGFNISASKDGCFSFTHKGKTYYYDLSLEDLPYNGDGGGMYDMKNRFHRFWNHSIEPRGYRN